MTKTRFTHSFQQNILFFNAEVTQLIKKLNSRSKFTGIEFHQTQDDAGNHIFKLYCGLFSLPNGGTKDLNKLPALNHSIFMTGYIQPDLVSKTDITSYCTEINYCKIIEPKNPSRFKSITGFHYDVVIPKDSSSKDNNHPILHAQQNSQCGKRLFEKADYAQYKKNYDCIFPAASSDEIRTIRIPTPQMDMLSAIIMVIADYLVHSSDNNHKKYFTDFLEKIYQRMMPLSFRTSTKINNNFISQEKLLNIWYPLF